MMQVPLPQQRGSSVMVIAFIKIRPGAYAAADAMKGHPDAACG